MPLLQSITRGPTLHASFTAPKIRLLHYASTSTGMSTVDSSKASWKDPALEKMFIDLCIEEANNCGKRGGSLNAKSWEVISKKFKDAKGVCFSQRQLKNHWDYLKKKYMTWTNLVGKTGHGYDPVTNTVNWNAQQWDDYLQSNPEARVFRFKGLDHADEMRALFEGISATGKGAWGPSREICLDEIGSSTNQQDKSTNQQDKSPMDVSVDSDSARPSSSKNSKKSNEKQRKRGKCLEEDNEIQAILKALTKTDGPSIEESNHVLDEMTSIEMHDPM